jgi:hypothetical protein
MERDVMKTKWATLSMGVWLGTTSVFHGQGFINLDFESATVPLTQPPSPPGVPTVDIAVALPGWSAFIGSNQVNSVMYNNQTLDTSSVALLRNNYPFISVIEGAFSVFLMGGRTEVAPGTFILTDTALRQTGLVPIAAQSMQFRARQVVPPLSSIAVSLGEEALSVVPLQVTSEYTLFGVDVTTFQGQTKELQFTVLHSTDGGGGIGFLLDSISFSNEPIPEPSTIGLIALGVLLIPGRLWPLQRS